jgi:hypothetical protein
LRGLVRASLDESEGTECIRDIRGRAAVTRGSGRDRRQESLRKGTIFEGSRVPLHKWFLSLGIFAAADEGVSARKLEADLDVGSNRTALGMLDKIRGTLRHVYPKLGGDVHIYGFPITDIWPQTDSPGTSLTAALSSEDNRTLIGVFAESDDGSFFREHLQKNAVVHTYGGVDSIDYVRWSATPHSGHGRAQCDVPTECRDLVDGLTSWLRHTHKRCPQPLRLQPYLDEYAFHLNHGGRPHHRNAALVLISLALGYRLPPPGGTLSEHDDARV